MSYDIQKILVPVDLSEASLNALETAIVIAKKKNASVQILNISDNTLDLYPDYRNFLHASANSNDILTALITSINKTHGFKPDVVFDEGPVADLILKKTNRQVFDLVVMGTHGESGYRDNFIGTTAYNVVKYSNCPVLLVPPNKKITAFTKAIFPVRPLANALSTYDIICHFLSAGSKLEILGLVYKIQEKTTLLENLVNDISGKINSDNISAHTAWLFGNAIGENILSMIMQAKADLVIVTAALDVTTKPFFIGPHTQKIINTARIPVLCIKRPGSPCFA